MVRLWAEKELRNLRRLEEGGIRAPRVVEGRENVLVMEFLGHDDEYVLGHPDSMKSDLGSAPRLA